MLTLQYLHYIISSSKNSWGDTPLNLYTLENAEVLAGIEIVEELSSVENTEKLVAVVEEQTL